MSGMESSLPDGVENQKRLRIRWHQWDGLLTPVGQEVLLRSLGFQWPWGGLLHNHLVPVSTPDHHSLLG